MPQTTACTDMEEYLFDLNGFLVLRGALSPAEIDACNATYDELETTHACAAGPVHVRDGGGPEGLMLQQLYEGGPVWEGLIDHPSWFEKVVHFIGTDDPENFDRHHGVAFIDECFGTIRGPGGALRLHSGGHVGTIRTQFRYHAGKFHCGQINILFALTDIGPGDGATMVIPGSHKSNLKHPQTVPAEKRGDDTSMDGIAGAVEVHMKKGDALLFVDAIMHGSARRTNTGNRRVAVYRYGPSWGYFRHKHRPSDGLLKRLSPARRQIINPHGSETT